MHNDDTARAVEAHFSGHSESRELFEVLFQTIEEMNGVQVRVTKSQVAFRRRRAFAWAWMPGLYLKVNVAPLVVSFSLRSRVASPRVKQVVEPSPGRFIHHVELVNVSQIDDEVSAWLWRAWDEAG